MRHNLLLPEGQALRPADLVPRALRLLPVRSARYLSSAPPPATAHSRRARREERAMSRSERNGDDAWKGGSAGCGGGAGGRPASAAGTWAVSALCLLFSVGSAAACLLLGAQAAALQGRVAALEERELLRRAEPPGSLAAWAEPHLERLLREVRRGARGGRGPAGSVSGCGAGGGEFAHCEPRAMWPSPQGLVARWLCARASAGAACAESGGWGCQPRAGYPAVPASESRSRASGRGKRELEGPFQGQTEKG